MEHNPYSELPRGGLILRDYLAAARTVLANERTFLAYVRTALSLLVTGAAVIKFSGYPAMELLGWGFIPVGMAILGVGVWRYRRMGAYIDEMERQGDPHPEDAN